MAALVALEDVGALGSKKEASARLFDLCNWAKVSGTFIDHKKVRVFRLWAF